LHQGDARQTPLLGPLVDSRMAGADSPSPTMKSHMGVC
jgi:hypothetical protein